MQESTEKRWYVIRAQSGYEQKVKVALEERIKLHNLSDQFGQVLVPTEKVVEMRRGQKRKSEHMFYPGYVLVEMALTDETWHLIRGIPKVAGFIGGDKPAPLTAVEADKILQRVKEGVDKPRPKTLFDVEEVVRIIDGPFKDFEGVVKEVNYAKSRLKVAVLIFGRSTPVELDFGQVEKT